ncbi:MAG: methyltransferase domain-containing protein [Pyrinomonadaceae bacterium]
MSLKAVNFGIDGPVFVFNTFLIGCLLISGGLALVGWLTNTTLHEIESALIITAGAVCFLIAATILWGSKVGKLRLRDEIINSLNLRGDEYILGVGCGHGLLIIGAAKFLNKNGRAIGIDVWKEVDQAGNSPQATLKNAEIEGVADRVAVETADARNMPFADNFFDLILTSWVLHNLIRKRERQKALSEIVRVTKSGGEIIIADVWLGYEYAKFFRNAGLTQISVSRPYFLFFAPTFVVRAKKS